MKRTIRLRHENEVVGRASQQRGAVAEVFGVNPHVLARVANAPELPAQLLDLREIEFRAVRIHHHGLDRVIGGRLLQAAGHIQQRERPRGVHG